MYNQLLQNVQQLLQNVQQLLQNVQQLLQNVQQLLQNVQTSVFTYFYAFLLRKSFFFAKMAW